MNVPLPKGFKRRPKGTHEQNDAAGERIRLKANHDAMVLQARKNQKKQRKAKNSFPKGKVSVKHVVRVGGSSFVVNAMPTAANSSNGGAGQAPVTIVPAKIAADHLIEVMRNPFIETYDADWPDPFTLVPTRKSKDLVHQSLAIFNGTDRNDGSVCMYARGDPYHAWGVPSSVGPPVSSGKSPPNLDPYQISWAGCTNDMNSSMPLNSMARPIAVGHRFTYSAVGPYHTIVMRVMELPPWGPISSTYTNFPTYTNLGPTFAQREYFRAREVVLQPGETLEVNCYPADADCLVFATTGQEREASSVSGHAKSWSGFVMWAHGLTAQDTVYHDAIIRHSWYLPSPLSAPATSPTPATLTHPSAPERDRALSTTVTDVSNGWNVFKSVLSGLTEFATALAPFLAAQGKIALAAPISPTAIVPSTFGTYLLMPDSGAPKHLAELFGLPSKMASSLPKECKDTVKPAVPPPASDDEKKDGFEDLSKSVLLKELKKRM